MQWQALADAIDFIFVFTLQQGCCISDYIPSDYLAMVNNELEIIWKQLCSNLNIIPG
jgi:hypothetical protein